MADTLLWFPFRRPASLYRDARKGGGRMHVRTTRELDELVDEAAGRAKMSRSDWVRSRIETAAVREVNASPSAPPQPTRRRLVMQRTSPQLCTHPLSTRTRPDASGESRCLSCGSKVQRL